MIDNLYFINPKINYTYEITPYINLGIAYLSATIKQYFDDSISIKVIDGMILEKEIYEKKKTKLSHS